MFREGWNLIQNPNQLNASWVYNMFFKINPTYQNQIDLEVKIKLKILKSVCTLLGTFLYYKYDEENKFSHKTQVKMRFILEQRF